MKETGTRGSWICNVQKLVVVNGGGWGGGRVVGGSFQEKKGGKKRTPRKRSGHPVAQSSNTIGLKCTDVKLVPEERQGERNELKLDGKKTPRSQKGQLGERRRCRNPQVGGGEGGLGRKDADRAMGTKKKRTAAQ